MLFRDAEALKRCDSVDTLVVDKTGTLTEGKPKLVTVEPAGGFTAEELLAHWPPGWSAAASIRWQRRLSAARRAKHRTCPVQDFQSFTGHGVRGVVDGKQVAIGNSVLMGRRRIEH